MELIETTAFELSAAIARKEISITELMAATLARIEQVNGQVNAIVSLRDRDELMAEAREADARAPKGWLHGIPIAIKDLANVRGMPTSMGSPLFTGTVAEEDDLLVARLRDAGVLIIGKTNTPEFGLGSHTFNPVHGTTRNPYDQSRSAGGSSGGAAVALATRMLAVADGSDMMGSLRNPAGWNNVYGLRPTWGTVPAEPTGDVFLHHLATSGPMARHPRDLALLLDTMTGPDGRQPHSQFPGIAAPLLDNALPRQRIGWLGDWGGALPYEEGILDISRAALAQLEDMGHVVEDVPPPFPSDQLWDSWTTLRSFSVAAGSHPLYLDEEKRALLKPAAQWEIERGIALTALEIHRASVTRSEWFRAALVLMRRYDVLVLPSAQCWPFDAELVHPTEIAGVAMDTYHHWMQVVVPAGLIGLPVVNIPIGFGDNGLPAGLQVIGRRGAGGHLCQFAMAWHEATDWPGRRPPPL